MNGHETSMIRENRRRFALGTEFLLEVTPNDLVLLLSEIYQAIGGCSRHQSININTYDFVILFVDQGVSIRRVNKLINSDPPMCALEGRIRNKKWNGHHTKLIIATSLLGFDASCDQGVVGDVLPNLRIPEWMRPCFLYEFIFSFDGRYRDSKL